MEISKAMLIQLRGLLNTAGKDLMKIGQRPHGGWAYHEWKAEECLKMAKRIDKQLKQEIKKNNDKQRDNSRLIMSVGSRMRIVLK